MTGLQLLPLGVGDAFSARNYSTCFGLHAADSWLLIDCPHPVRKMMAEASASAGVRLDIDGVSAVVLTHLHADHCSGLEIFAYYSRYVLGRTVTLLAHPTVAQHLWDHHLAGSMRWSRQAADQSPVQRHFEDFFHLIPLSEKESVPIGPFTVRCRPTIHSVPTTALLIEGGGRTLGFSADTAFDPTLIEWLSSADLIIHECTPGHMHTPYDRLAALPADLRAKLRLIHYPDDFDHVQSAIEPLSQGRCYQV
jgi:glyoxylase-like metal-dependent hydrolase (beta-lactamase superfamily II)